MERASHNCRVKVANDLNGCIAGTSKRSDRPFVLAPARLHTARGTVMNQQRTSHGNTNNDGPPLRYSGNLAVASQTIDIKEWAGTTLTSTGSFDMRYLGHTSLGKLMNALPIPAFLLDEAHTVWFCNEACAKLCDDRQRLQGIRFSRLFVSERNASEVEARLNKVFAQRKPESLQMIVSLENRRLWARIHVHSLRLAEQRLLLALIEDLTAEQKDVLLSKQYSETLRDVRDQRTAKAQRRTSELTKAVRLLRREIVASKRAQESRRIAERVIAASNEAMVVTDAKGDIVGVNAAFCQITGYSSEEFLGKHFHVVGSDRHNKDFWSHFWHVVRETARWNGEIWGRRKNGQVYPQLLSLHAVSEDDGTVTNYVGVFSDLTEAKKIEENLDRLALYDTLTGLPNRLLFRERLSRALIQANHNETKVALVFLGIDGLKKVNNIVGQDLADELLVSVARRLERSVRECDTVSRLGDDEFVVIVPTISDSYYVGPMAQRIMAAVSQPFVVNGNEIILGVSAGIGIYPDDTADSDLLVQHAAVALHHAKTGGENKFQFFSEKMNLQVMERHENETTLRHAMAHDGLVVYYQPVIHAETGQIIGMEALLRLKDSEGIHSAPAPFIQVAENRGLIVPLGHRVLQMACRQNKALQEMGLPPLTVAVNLSMRQLSHPDLVKTVLHVLDDTGLSPSYLELELTETAIMSDPELSIRVLHELRSKGIRITLDDFGTGYSSLSYLKHLPLDKIKIDKSFVDDIASDSAHSVLVGAIIEVAHDLKMAVVAEGVESPLQLEALRALNCDAWQGYLCSPAVSAPDLEKLLRNGHEWTTHADRGLVK